MLLSHHPPCDYERTWRIGSLHVCVRCLGVLIGTGVALVSWDSWSSISLLAASVAAIPGVADFVLHELGTSPSHNPRRFITGACFGIFVAAALWAALDARWLHLLFSGLWIILLQIAAAAVLRGAGRIEALLARYEEGVLLPRK